MLMIINGDTVLTSPTGKALVDFDTGEVMMNYHPPTPPSKRHDELLSRFDRIETLMGKGYTVMVDTPSKDGPTRPKVTVTYVIGEGVDERCRQCGRVNKIPKSERAERERPVALELPCGCGKAEIIWKEG